mgnify:CR=1 FL=1
MGRLVSNKILVTGGAGFIGSEFIRQIISKGFSPVILDALTYAGDLRRLESVKGKFTFYKIDIANQKKLLDIFRRERPAQVVHFAAESHVDRSILSDAEFVRTNIVGTQSLLSASRELGVKRFVHMSTDEVYGAIKKGLFKEDFPLMPSSPYSASKASADLLVRAYVHTFGFPALIVRASNNYGPWQYPEKFIPVVIYKALTNQPIPVYAKGLNVREWLHIADCAAGIFRVLQAGRAGEIYNIGSGDECRNIDLVYMMLKLLHAPKELITYVQDRPGHDWRYALDSTKIRRELSWKPKVSLEEGMKETVRWNMANQHWLKQKVKYLTNYWSKVYRS